MRGLDLRPLSRLVQAFLGVGTERLEHPESEAPPAPEDRQPAKQHPLGLGKQLVAPVDDGPQGLLPVVDAARPGREQPEPVVQPIGDLLHR
jgi:hypothetical protein